MKMIHTITSGSFLRIGFEALVIETNRYGSQYLNSTTNTLHARAHKWTSATAKKLKRFLDLVLLIGILDKKGRIVDH